ncbi:MAG: DUF3748 domain-containing protein, partial [Marivirga sp.]|nr:DUF3748 domain-containing protein [Marivirga sp.]
MESYKARWGAVLLFLCSGCHSSQENNHMKEMQLTTGPYGHTLNSTQVFSPDGQWIYYDTRNDDTHISRTGEIEKVNVVTGEISKVYSTRSQTVFGPGVGAVACHPFQNKIIFIHGLVNSTEQQPYGFTRRFGAIVKDGHSDFSHAEARTIQEPLIAGALRGGTHAHSWSSDGEWISFTYNDFLMESLEKLNGGVRDLRTIGVMAPLENVKVASENEENFSGEYFSVVAATVTDTPEPGSDEIERAFDECWIGEKGYTKPDVTMQRRAIAFQGNVRTKDGSLLTEVFVADLPEYIDRASELKPLQGTLLSRPNVPEGSIQRRVTFTTPRKHPGLQGPRFRLRTSPDGSLIYFLMNDDMGIVQVFSVPTSGGSIQQVTNLIHPVQAQFNVSPDGKKLSVIADNSIWIVDVPGGKSIRITERTKDEDAPVGGALWGH